MSKHDVNQWLSNIGQHALSVLERISANARAGLDAVRGSGLPPLAAVNTLTYDNLIKRHRMEHEEARRNLAHLCEEPAIARIVVAGEGGAKQTLYIARATPPSVSELGAVIVSYRAPMGQIAAIPVGREVDIATPAGSRSYEVLERTTLHPTRTSDGWDSLRTIVQGENDGPFTIESLLAFLRSLGTESDALDPLEQLLQSERRSAIVIEGIRRSVITKMGLRDQPLLDEFQDRIFRLTIDKKVVLLGPPGTGKTTTLIKRLGLKLDPAHLTDHESALVARSAAGSGNHGASWVMFTPSELLKQYVKEAFAHEQIPASDEHIHTWSDYRRDVARNKLGVLRGSSGSGFVLRDGLVSLQPTTVGNQTGWYDDFNQWQLDHYWHELSSHADELSNSGIEGQATLGRRLSRIIRESPESASVETLLALDEAAADVTRAAEALRSDLDDRLRRAFVHELRRDGKLLDNLLAFLKAMETPTELGEDGDEHELEEEEDDSRPRGEREEAFEAYKRAVRAQARAVVLKRSVNRRSRNGRILEWLGSRGLSEGDCVQIGQMLHKLAALRRFANPIRLYVDRMPARYRRFRRTRHGDGRWYILDSFEQADLHPLELDLILLAMLRAARGLLQDQRVLATIEEPRYRGLNTVRQLYRSQITVDEATDFSPLQLGAMEALGDPVTRSFIACGDFNQRITEWGSRSTEELRWAIPGIEVHPVNITYRHTKQLNDLAHKLAVISGGTEFVAALPPDVDSEGVTPVLGVGLAGAKLIDWLAFRIEEIEQFTRALPSIAILVESDGAAASLAQDLNARLASRNIRVVACPEGRVVGQENDVRVFDIQHIKGLEFEAVFFVGIDELAHRQSELFDKFLYVGTTRAATYLGVTCSGTRMPKRLAHLEGDFVSSWSHHQDGIIRLAPTGA